MGRAGHRLSAAEHRGDLIDWADGLSHTPVEDANPADAVVGVEVMLGAISALVGVDAHRLSSKLAASPVPGGWHGNL